MYSGRRRATSPARTIRAFTLAGTLATFAVLASQTPTVDTTDAPTSDPTPLETHAGECWTGREPRLADVPGHVIVSLPTGEQVYSARLVGPALDSLFGGEPADFDVLAFCL